MSGYFRIIVSVTPMLALLPLATHAQVEARWVGSSGLLLCEARRSGPASCEPLLTGTKIQLTGTSRKNAAGRTFYEVVTDDGNARGWISEFQRDSLELEDPDIRDERARMACTQNQPRVGMSEQEVLASCWGKPRYRSRTGVEGLMRDQWAYSDGRYLYFDNGRLLAIQE
jgi:hypothetical protein